MASKDGHIVLDNTLDARMQIVFKQQLPEVSVGQIDSVTFSFEIS